jgi:hypothetical protein
MGTVDVVPQPTRMAVTSDITTILIVFISVLSFKVSAKLRKLEQKAKEKAKKMKERG